jgi:hypothetical protein
MMEAARTSETLVNFYQITRRYNLEDNHLYEIITSEPIKYFTEKFENPTDDQKITGNLFSAVNRLQYHLIQLWNPT